MLQRRTPQVVRVTRQHERDRIFSRQRDDAGLDIFRVVFVELLERADQPVLMKIAHRGCSRGPSSGSATGSASSSSSISSSISRCHFREIHGRKNPYNRYAMKITAGIHSKK